MAASWFKRGAARRVSEEHSVAASTPPPPRLGVKRKAGWNVPCSKPGEDEAFPEQEGPLLPAPEQVRDPECSQRFL